MSARELFFVTVVCALLSACTVEGHVVARDKEKWMQCHDKTRDAMFTFHAQNAKARIGYGTESTVTITDTSGTVHTYTESQAASLVCIALGEKPGAS